MANRGVSVRVGRETEKEGKGAQVTWLILLCIVNVAEEQYDK